MPLQPASTASGTRTSSTRAGKQNRDTAPGATRSAEAQRPTRRPDPRVRTRSLRPDQFRARASPSAPAPNTYGTRYVVGWRAREYQIYWPDVKYSPVRFGGRKRSRLIDLLIHRQSTVRVYEPTEPRRLTEFLNPTGRLDPRTGGGVWGAKTRVVLANQLICRRNRVFAPHTVGEAARRARAGRASGR
jgi:hypothetical protein